MIRYIPVHTSTYMHTYQYIDTYIHTALVGPSLNISSSSSSIYLHKSPKHTGHMDRHYSVPTTPNVSTVQVETKSCLVFTPTFNIQNVIQKQTPTQHTRQICKLSNSLRTSHSANTHTIHTYTIHNTLLYTPKATGYTIITYMLKHILYTLLHTQIHDNHTSKSHNKHNIHIQHANTQTYKHIQLLTHNTTYPHTYSYAYKHTTHTNAHASHYLAHTKSTITQNTNFTFIKLHIHYIQHTITYITHKKKYTITQ